VVEGALNYDNSVYAYDEVVFVNQTLIAFVVYQHAVR